MSVGILLITHEGIGHALLAVATRLLRKLPLETAAFEVPFDGDVDALLPQASGRLRSRRVVTASSALPMPSWVMRRMPTAMTAS